MRSVGLAVGAVMLLTGALQGQDTTALRSGRRPLLALEREVALARSAAPPAVSDSATVYVLGDSAYRVAVRGTNGNACFVSRDWMDTIEPHCFDAEGAATILPMEIMHVEILHRGGSEAAARRAIADALQDGRLRLPSRPAMSYMMSSDQWLIDDQRQVGGHWHPHLMIYVPYVTNALLGLGGGSAITARVFGEGTPWASIVIQLTEFVPPAGVASR